MLKISKPIGTKQAKHYYRSELQTEKSIVGGENASGHYQGEWFGILAEKMGLNREVGTEQFERLCHGQHPFTDEQLIRHVPAKRYTSKNGRSITTMEHRALWDATFSAPKSVSLAALVGADERIIGAHQESVRLALIEVERHTDARMGGNKLPERTGMLVAALFDHDSARPDKTLRYAAPQLHTHAVIFCVLRTKLNTDFAPI